MYNLRMKQAKITTEKPPCWDMLVRAFNCKWRDIAVTYGGVIYSPNPVVDDVLEHELVHVRQQEGHDAEAWCERYIIDPKFRYRMELEAYREQYGFWKKYIKNKHEIRKALERFACELSGQMYGGCAIYAEALKQIRNGR